MERTGHSSRVLMCKLVAAVLLGAMFFAAGAVFFAAPSYAEEKEKEKEKEESDDPEQARLESDAKLATILILLEIKYAQHLQLIKDMRKTYNENYERDHKPLANRVNPEMGPYATIQAAAVGYRGPSPLIYSDIYKNRENAFKNTMSGSSGGNKTRADKIAGEDQTQIQKMNEVSRNADGYMQLIKAGTQEANYLNMELAELRADTMRQLDVQMRAAIEEAQDDFDGTSAFEGAVSTWKNTGSGGGY